MEEGETVSLSRKELRKQKLMEYLATKGKLKLPNPKPYLQNDGQVKKPMTSAVKVVKGKENKVQVEGTKVQTLAAGCTKHPDRKAFGVTYKTNIKGSILTGQQNASCPGANSGRVQPKPNQNLVLTRTYTVVSSKSNLNAANHLKMQHNIGMQSSGKATSKSSHVAVIPSNTRFSRSSGATRSIPMKSVSVRMSLVPTVKTRTGLIPAVIQPRNTKSQTSTTATDPSTTSVTNKVRSGRMSLVPIVKTRTGLIPAVIQPRNTKSQTSTTATDPSTTSVTNKVRSGTSSVSLRSAVAQRRTFTTTTLNNPAKERTTGRLTARAGFKGQRQNSSNSKPLLDKLSQLSCKSQLSNALKSTFTPSKCTAAPIKSEGRVGVSKTNRSAGPPTDRSTNQRSVSSQPCKVASQTSLAPASRYSYRAVSWVTRDAVAEPGRKSKTCKETQSKKGHSSVNVPPQPTGIKRAEAPVMSQTVPQPARAISQATDGKMPKALIRVIPQTEGKKLTAAQEERMRKLQEWRESKGISYKRPPMPVKPQVRRTVAVPQPFWTAMMEEDEAHSVISAIDRSLADCIKLLGEDCPPDQVKEVLSRLPEVSKKFAKYWICQARLMEKDGNLDVLPMFEEAVRVVLEPVDELRTVVFEILKKKEVIQASVENETEEDQIESTGEDYNNPLRTPKPTRVLIHGEKGDSSVVKYKITATPGGPPSQQREPVRVNGQEVRFFTPVRRSVRIERASLRYPVSLQDHDLCVASYNDLISEEDKENSEEHKGGETSPAHHTPMYVYRQNEALKDKVLVHVVCDEGILP
uniref:cytoskeleton-associated protein 2-like isoform X1 n=1 Tax=Monopterus albus TaxID=43700 RepID=UPI0009B32A62|nr:cytoskeleton-associated protein 2-like isoform X1 [Monopterus albus]